MAAQAFAALGDTLTQALMRGDFVLYRSVFVLPLTISPRGDECYVIATEAALLADFELYLGNLRGYGVTDIFRQILEFTVIDPQHVRVRCATHIMVRAQRIVEPFETLFSLREQPDGWRISEIESSGGHINWSLGRTEINNGAFQAKTPEAEARDGET